MRLSTQSNFKKEPKFVPYEPYKGAVTPLTSSKPNGNRKPVIKKQTSVKEEADESVEAPETKEVKKGQGQTSSPVIVSEPRFKSETARYWSDLSKDEYQRMKKELEEKERELNEVKQQMVDMEKQVRYDSTFKSHRSNVLILQKQIDFYGQVFFLFP